MAKILCVDGFLYFLLPDRVEVTNLMDALQHPVSRDYENGDFKFRSKKAVAIQVELVDDSVINPPVVANPPSPEIVNAFDEL